MPIPRRVSLRQLEILLEFAESQPEVALGRYPAGPNAIQRIRELWQSVAAQLNAVAEGLTKTHEQWRRYWIELKAKTKAKAANARRYASATGGGPSKFVPLTHVEERVLAIIGPVAVEGLPGVRIPFCSVSSLADAATAVEMEILDVTSHPPTSSTSADPIPTTIPQPLSPNSEPAMDVEWLEDLPSPLASDTQPPPPPPPPRPRLRPPVSAATGIQSEMPDEPNVSSREDRPTERSTLPALGRTRSQRQIRRDERVPRWAYEIESRRIAAEERLAAAVETLAGMVQLLRDIRDDIRKIARDK